MKNGLRNWFQENFLNIVGWIVAIIVAWTILNMRVGALEARVAQYPSQDWFQLKFNTIDTKLNDLSTKIEEHMKGK